MVLNSHTSFKTSDDSGHSTSLFYRLYANIYALVANPSDVIGVVVWAGNAAVVEPKNNLSIWIISLSVLLVCGDVL
jgi:hypothetical protein